MVTTRSATPNNGGNSPRAPTRKRAKTTNAHATSSGNSAPPPTTPTGTTQQAPPNAPATASGQVSPATSTGPDFHPPRPVPVDTITACRKKIPRNTSVRGFQNDKFECYFNAMIVMLLSSRRLMAWIEAKYIPTLMNAEVTIKTNVAAALASRETSESDPLQASYTDALCELHALGEVYWSQSDGDVLELARKAFFAYVGKEITALPGRDFWDPNEQQDATEFLNYFMEIAERQRLEYFGELMQERRRSQSPDPIDIDAMAKYMEVGGLDVGLVTGISQTMRIRCNMCGTLPGQPTMTRIQTLYEMESWPLSFGDLSAGIVPPVNGKGRGRGRGRRRAKGKAPEQVGPPVPLEDLIGNDMRGQQEGWLCGRCRPYIIDQTHAARLAAAGDDADEQLKAQKQNEAEIDGLARNQTINRKRFCKLPEVLILTMTRFQLVGDDYEKDNTKVQFGEVLDLTSYLEHHNLGQDPLDRSSAKYRLIAIISHRGDREAGHYINHVLAYKNPQTGMGSFTEVNDDQVATELDLDDVLKSQDEDFTPYVFLYERIVNAHDADQGAEKDPEKRDTPPRQSTPAVTGTQFKVDKAETANWYETLVTISATVKKQLVNFPPFVLEPKLPTTNGGSTTVELKKGASSATVIMEKKGPSNLILTINNRTPQDGAGVGAATGATPTAVSRSRAQTPAQAPATTTTTSPIAVSRWTAINRTPQDGGAPPTAATPTAVSRSRAQTPARAVTPAPAPPAPTRVTKRKRAATPTGSTSPRQSKRQKAAPAAVASTAPPDNSIDVSGTAGTRAAPHGPLGLGRAGQDGRGGRGGQGRGRGPGRGGRGAARGAPQARILSSTPFRQARRSDPAYTSLVQGRFDVADQLQNNWDDNSDCEEADDDNVTRTPKSRNHTTAVKRKNVTWAAGLDNDSHTEEGSVTATEGTLSDEALSFGHGRRGVRVVEYRSLPDYMRDVMQMSQQLDGRRRGVTAEMDDESETEFEGLEEMIWSE
ncbi:hypothetical protein ABEF95_016347 [Exophiala dermatitidis]